MPTRRLGVEPLESRCLLTAILADGFETGAINPAWTECFSCDNLQVVNGTAHSGNYAARITYAKDEDDAHLDLHTSLLHTQGEAYIEFWQMFPTGFSGRNLKQTALVDNEGNSNDGTMIISAWTTTTQQFQVTFYEEDRAIWPEFSFPAGQWFKLGYHVKYNTPGQSNGLFRLWVNDQLLAQRNDVNYRNMPGAADIIWVGGNYSGAGVAPQPFERYIDDIYIATTPRTSQPPELRGSEVWAMEGNSGNRQLVFPVSLSAPSQSPVSVEYVTRSVRATPGSDYLDVRGTLIFSPGETSKSIAVTVVGDMAVELNEFVIVDFKNPSGLTIATPEVWGTIINDDLPVLSGLDVGIDEGDSGERALTYTLTLSAPVEVPVTVNYSTRPVRATPGTDYRDARGTLTFNSGETSKSIVATVLGDEQFELDEFVVLDLSNTVGATLARDAIWATIRNDDLGDLLGAVERADHWLLDRDRDPEAEIDRRYGLPGDRYVTGKWLGTTDQMGVVRNGYPDGLLRWLLDTDGDRENELSYVYGWSADFPVVGNWDGLGTDNIGIVRGGYPDGLLRWLLDTDGDENPNITYAFGWANDLPIVGDFNGDGLDDIGVVRQGTDGYLLWLINLDNDSGEELSFRYGLNSVHQPIVGDWNGDGVSNVGVTFAGTDGYLHWLLGAKNEDFSPYEEVRYGLPGFQPVVGRWGYEEPAMNASPPNPWHNSTWPEDINSDSQVTAKDALLAINYINAFGMGRLPASSSVARSYIDVNNDGAITPPDALAVINRLNAFGTGGGPAGEAGATFASSPDIGELDGSIRRLSGSVAQAADVDLFKFSVVTGQTVNFDIDTATNGPPGLGSYLRIFNAQGTELAGNNDRRGPDDPPVPNHDKDPDGFDSFISLAFPTGGTFYVGVSNWQHRQYDPISGRTALGSDPEWLTGSYELVITSRFAPLPDLVAAQFSYSVDAERGNRDDPADPQTLNGPLPVNSQFRATVLVRNRGTAAAGAFRVQFYASTDDVYDPGDLIVGTAWSQPIPTGGQAQVNATLVLPPNRFSQQIWVGAIVNPLGDVAERDSRGLFDHASGIDGRYAPVYDAIPSVSIQNGFASNEAARQWLLDQGFAETRTATGPGFERSLDATARIFSRFYGEDVSGDYFRQNAFIFGPGGVYRFYNVTTQRWDERRFTTFSVVIQGSAVLGEPNPLRFGNPAYIAYVYGWHDRF